MIHIYDAQVEKAIAYLAETEVDHAKAKSKFHGLAQLRKSVRGVCFAKIEGGVKEREMRAEAHEDYLEHLKKIEDAELDFNIIHNRRSRAELTIDLYRTMAASLRKGNI